MAQLRIGDIIALRHMKPHDGWLAAEGILSEDLILIKELNNFENCLWEVTVQNQYNAVKEYEDKILNNRKDDDDDNGQDNATTSAEDTQEFYDHFLMASMIENKLNERLMTLKTGKPVVFGDVIQLRHVKTKGFLTISSNQLAKHEKENMRVEIDSNGNPLSWLEFMPRFKYDKEGQQIVHENECHIRVHERPSEFVHAARKVSKFSANGNREINCSLENSVWTISIYQQCWESKSKNILCGQLVSLQETETSSYLGVESNRSSQIRPISLCPQQLSLTVSDCNVGTNLLWMVEGENPFAGGQVTHKDGKYALRDLNSGMYMKLDSDGMITVPNRSNCSYFEFIGGQGLETGSPIQESGMIQIMSRNQWVSTKKSANIYKSQGTGSEDRAHALSFIISSKIQHSLGVDLFVGVEAANLFQQFKSLVRSKKLRSMSPGQVENEFKVLFSCLDTLTQFLCQPTMKFSEENDLVAVLEPSGAASLVIRQTMLREQGILNALLDIIEMAAIGLLNELDGDPRLKKLASQTSYALDEYQERAHEDAGGGGGSGEDSSDSNLPIPSNKFPKMRASFGGTGNINQEHLQRLSIAFNKHREKKKRATFANVVLDAMAQKKRGSLVDLPSSSSSQSHGNSNFSKSKSKSAKNFASLSSRSRSSIREESSHGKDDASVVSLPKELARCCFSVLYLAIVRNHSSQIHIADYFSLLLNQVREQDISVACVQEMLRDNLEMLQTKVGENEIKIFLDLLIKTEMNVTIMKLLRSTCTCPHGVDNTQRMVVNALFQREKVSRTNSVSHSTATKWRRRASLKANAQDPNPLGFIPITPSASSLNLLKKTRSVLISIKEDPSVLRKESWNIKPIYFPSNGNMEVVMGYSLVDNGLPNLVLSWHSYPDGNADDFTMMTLFGCQNDVPFRYLCNYSQRAGGRNGGGSMYLAPAEIAGGGGSGGLEVGGAGGATGGLSSLQRGVSDPRRGTKGAAQKRIYSSSLIGKNNRKLKKGYSSSSKEKSLTDRKKQIASYFIAQLYLAADLCLDRNYVSIALLEKVYSYHMLLTILATKATTNQFKAPVCRMIRAIYIDRDPQTEVKFPRLIKTSADLRGNPMGGFDDSGGRSPYSFGLLQQIISDYLHNTLDITRCDELSAEMMALLLELVRFGYYNTTEQLQDVIDPLVLALEQHRTVVRRRTGASQEEESEPEEDEDEMGDLKNFQAVVAAAVAANNSRNSLSHSIFNAIQHIGSQDSFRMGMPMAKVTPEADHGGEDGGAPETADKYRELPDSANMTPPTERGEGGTTLPSPSDGNHLNNNLPLRCLGALESIQFMLFIISLVVATTILSLLQLFSNHQNSPAQDSFDLFVSIVFFVEITTRICCYGLGYGYITPFFFNVFNLIDLSVVILDLVLLSLDIPSLQGAAAFTKALKTIRILRLIRVMRAARLLKRIAGVRITEKNWTMPARYSSITEAEIRTIVGILKVLSIIHDRIQDRKLNSSFKAYVDWLEVERTGKPINAYDVYQSCLQQSHENGACIPKEFDVALLDIVMFSEKSLVKEALHLLMVHKSQDRLLKETMHCLQIISNPKVEEKYRELNYCLNEMRKRGESFEIWGQFLTETDAQEAEELHHLVLTITRILKSNKTSQLIDFKPCVIAEYEIQQLLANLGGLEDVMVLQRALMDASLEKVDQRIIKILKACNEMVKIFLLQNPNNQNLAFPYFSWFIEHVDAQVGSSRVVRAMLQQNKDLIKQCPRKYINEFIQKIVKNGRNPDYLDLFVGLVDVDDSHSHSSSHSGGSGGGGGGGGETSGGNVPADSGVAAVRSEIAKHLTSVDRSSRILFWCCSRQSPEYEERLAAMAPFVGYDLCPPDDELSPELRYHINLLHLLAGCKLGPKLQGVYPLDDMIIAILDPGTIFNVQYALGILLIDALDVKMEGIESSDSMWAFFEVIVEFLEKTESELLLWLRVTSPHHRYCEQNTKWLHICLQVTINFFSNFEFSNFFSSSNYDSDVSFLLTERSEEEVNEIINRLSDAIGGIYEKNRDYLETDTAALFTEAISFVSQLSAEYTGEVSRGDTRGRPKRAKRRNNIIGNRSLSDEVQQVFYRRKFQSFLSLISSPDAIVHEVSVECFMNIPFVSTSVESDVRFEPFILKITNYIRSQIEKGSLASTLHKGVMPPTLWILRTLQHLLNDFYVMTSRRGEGSGGSSGGSGGSTGERSNDLMKYSTALNSCGITFLCLDLIAVGIDPMITTEAMSLLVALLRASPGNPQIQESIHLYLSETDSTLFFEQIKGILEYHMLWCQRFGIAMGFEEGTPYSLPESLVVVELLSTMCQNNFMSNKTILLNQEGNSRFVNLLDVLADFVDVLSRVESPACTKVGIVVMETVLVLLQGPCWISQEHFVLHTDILVALNRIMRSARLIDHQQSRWQQDRDRLKEIIIDVLRASIECLASDHVIIERVQTSIEVNVLHMLILPTQTDEFGSVKDLTSLTSLQAKYLVFLKTLNDSNMEIPQNAVNRLATDIGSIEVVWNQQVFTHYFHIPQLSQELSDSSKFKIVEDMNCSSQELKLFGFLQHAKDLYREAMHQHKLKRSGISNIWRLFGILTRAMLANVVLMNILLVIYYKEMHHELILPEEIHRILFGLNLIHIIASVVTLVVIIVMRVPVTYSTYLELGYTRVMAGLRCITDPLSFWYLCYLVIAIIAIERNYLYLSILLLDFIVLDSTSRDVLYAIFIPIRQLLSTFIIMMITLYISAAVIFVYFRTDYLHFSSSNDGMYSSMLLAFTFGLREPEGLGQAMFETIGTRMILDIAIYFIIVVILKNIFFGIIISTFAELRKKKEDRDDHLTNRCFICGVTRHEYNKRYATASASFSTFSSSTGGPSTSSGGPNDFTQHRNTTHNMWNYLYFILRILHQTTSEDTSLEIYIRKCISENDISWIPIGLMSAEDMNQNAMKLHSQEGDGLDQQLQLQQLQKQLQPQGRKPQHQEDGNKEQNLLEVKLNLILDKFVSQQQQQPQSGVSPSVRRRPLSKQSSFDDSDPTQQHATLLTLPPSVAIQGVTHHKSIQMKSLLSNIKQSLHTANQKLSEINSTKRVLRSQKSASGDFSSVLAPVSSPAPSEIKTINSNNSGRKKLFLRGPSLELVGDSDSDATSSPLPKISKTTPPHRYNLNVVAPSPSTPSSNELPTTPKSLNRRESIQSLGEISEESTDSD